MLTLYLKNRRAAVVVQARSVPIAVVAVAEVEKVRTFFNL